MEFHKNNHGFTLIELVVVIIILGVLAVVAAPKFIDVSKDAKIAVLHGLHGSIQSATQLATAKITIIASSQYPDIYNDSSQLVDMGNGVGSIRFVYGRFRAASDGIIRAIDASLYYSLQADSHTVCEPQGHDFCAFYINVFNNRIHNIVFLQQGIKASDNCYIRWYQDTDTSGQIVNGQTPEQALNSDINVSGCK